MDDLYKELILDHYQHPHNHGSLAGATNTYEDSNPLCGDRIRMEMKIANGVVEDIRFSGRGCAISQAAASMLTDEVKGKSVVELRKITKQTVLDLLGIPLGPSRLKCALLPLKVIKAGAYGMDEPIDDDDEE
jgi:nitrogen fixation NifU-like protein